MMLPSIIHKWANTALSLIYPEVCQFCMAEPATPAEGYMGESCRRTIKRIQPPWCERCGLPVQGYVTNRFECSNCRGTELFFSYARAAAAADGRLLEAIHLYKYRQALWLEPLLACLLIQAASPELATGDWDWIVPVPLHPTKRRERHFNQAERIGRRLSQATDIPLNSRFVRRIAFTRTQTQLSREERQRNVRGAFACRPDSRLVGSRLVLVDDVLTTGATTNACARELIGSGAAEVCVWTVARGI